MKNPFQDHLPFEMWYKEPKCHVDMLEIFSVETLKWRWGVPFWAAHGYIVRMAYFHCSRSRCSCFGELPRSWMAI